MTLDDTIEIAIEGETQERVVDYGTPLGDLLPKEVGGLPVLAALANNDVVPLDAPAIVDLRVRPLTLADEEGWQVYRRTLCFLLAAVLHAEFPGTDCRVRQSFGHNALFWTWDVPHAEREAKVAALRGRLAALVARDAPINHRVVGYEQMLQGFREHGQEDKAMLLEHRNPPYLGMAVCEEFYDLPQGVLATHSGVIRLFDIVPLRDGFVLEFPGFKTPMELDPMPPYDFLFEVYAEHLRWGEIIGIRNAGELNAAIADGSVADVINTVEALHEKRLSGFADRIAARVPRPHVVLVAGPSSAGKTTFAMRLCTHLRVLGLRPTLLSTDNYFVGDKRNPRDEHGNLDYECLQAVDVPRLNADLLKLIKGETIPLRKFNFREHEGYDSDHRGHPCAQPRPDPADPARGEVPHLRQRPYPGLHRQPQPRLDPRQPAASADGARRAVPRAQSPGDAPSVAQRARRRGEVGLPLPALRRPGLRDPRAEDPGAALAQQNQAPPPGVCRGPAPLLLLAELRLHADGRRPHQLHFARISRRLAPAL